MDTLKRLRLHVGLQVRVECPSAGNAHYATLVAVTQPEDVSTDGDEILDGAEPRLEICSCVPLHPEGQQDRTRSPGCFPADVAYICSVLAFNLRLSLHLQPFLAGTGQSSVRIQLAVAELPSANNVVVSLVRTPADAADLLGGVRLVLLTTCRAAVSSLLSCQSSRAGHAPLDMTETLELALRAHFGTPRLLSAGDVFPVLVDENEGEASGAPGRDQASLLCKQALTCGRGACRGDGSSGGELRSPLGLFPGG